MSNDFMPMKITDKPKFIINLHPLTSELWLAWLDEVDIIFEGRTPTQALAEIAKAIEMSVRPKQ